MAETAVVDEGAADALGSVDVKLVSGAGDAGVGCEARETVALVGRAGRTLSAAQIELRGNATKAVCGVAASETVGKRGAAEALTPTKVVLSADAGSA